MTSPVYHGTLHAPWGPDPVETEEWHYVGDSGEPAFQNSWANAGDPYAPLRFRLVTGRGASTGDIDTRRASLEIQGSVTGGDSGTVVFTLPDGFRPSHELHLPASDDLGGFVVLKVEANGDVSRGLA